MKIGVTAPGSSTHFMVQHLMVTHGLKRDDASFVGIGASASAVAAVQRGEIDAIVNVDPVINLLESQGLIKVVADTRTLAARAKSTAAPTRRRCSTRRAPSSRRSRAPPRHW